MDQVNKTLYIPLYGKARVSKQGFFRLMFAGRMAKAIYRLYEYESE